MSVTTNDLGVFSEVGTLKRVLTHYPDQGIGGVIPSKAQEWLYEDIVHLKHMQKEYEYFRKILLAYLDPEVLKQWFQKEHKGFTSDKSPAAVSSPDFVSSDKVIDTEELLTEVLSDTTVRQQLVAAICAVEGTRHTIQMYLADPNELTPGELARVLITGMLAQTKLKDSDSGMIFAPLPNFLFTRDIGITIGDHLLLSKTALQSRKRESILARYIAYYVLYKNDPEKVVEIADNHDAFLLDLPDRVSQSVTIEGGDVMMIAPKHLLIGYSERTTPAACEKVIQQLFKLKNCAIEKVSIVKLPHLRAMMHLDTVMTQVDRKTWVLFKQLIEPKSEDVRSLEIFKELGVISQQVERVAKVSQFIRRGNSGVCSVNHDIKDLKSLLYDISCNDYGCKPEEVQLIYSADGNVLHDEREQWTDSCNVTAIKEGVVLGYDRNDMTAKGFEKAGFASVCVKTLIDQLSDAFKANPELDISAYLEEHVPSKALLMVPSAELSRARGGPHCMTMPIARDYV